MKILIEVTQQDIDTARGLLATGSGKAKRSCCPLALAARRHFPRAEVGLSTLDLERVGDEWRRVKLPSKAFAFRRSFDRTEVPGSPLYFLEPFSFELEVPDEG